MITQYLLLEVLGFSAVAGLALGGYALGVEPMRFRVQRYTLTPPRWPNGLNLRIAVVADIHASKPWMSVSRIRQIVNQTNRTKPDLVVLLGDYAADHPWVTGGVHSEDWSAALAALTAPLGVHAILGNHDWWQDKSAQNRGAGPIFIRRALEKVGIPVYENDVVSMQKDGHRFWLAGLGDQLAFQPRWRFGYRCWQGVDDLPLTLSKITDDAPIILLAHEPDIFPKVPDRVSLTLSGHTHGGQVKLFNYAPVVPSRYGNRYAYGHIVESGQAQSALPRHLIVSGGLGCSTLPVRFGAPPEINVIELGNALPISPTP